MADRPTTDLVATIRSALDHVTVDALVTVQHANEMVDELAAALAPDLARAVRALADLAAEYGRQLEDEFTPTPAPVSAEDIIDAQLPEPHRSLLRAILAADRAASGEGDHG